MDPANFMGQGGTPPPWVQAMIQPNGTAPSAGFGGDFSDKGWPLWLTVLASVTLPVGFAANLWVLVRVLTRKNLRTSPFHLLLTKHCFTSALLCSLVYPLIIYKANRGLPKSVSDTNLCRVSNFLLMWLVSVVLFNHALVAMNRALSCYPHLAISRLLRGLKGTYCLIGCNSLVSFLLYIIPVAVYSVGWSSAFACYELADLIKNSSNTERDSLRTFLRYVFALLILLVLILSFVCYALIVFHLFGKGRNKSKQATKDSDKRRKEKVHALCVIASVFSVFLSCWVPFMWVILYKTELLLNKPFFGYLPMLETMLNPFLYVVCMPVFRPSFCGRQQTRVQPVPSGQTNMQSVSAQVNGQPKTNVTDSQKS